MPVSAPVASPPSPKAAPAPAAAAPAPAATTPPAARPPDRFDLVEARVRPYHQPIPRPPSKPPEPAVASAERAVGTLNEKVKTGGKVNAEDLRKAVDTGARDPDNSAAGVEFDVLKQFVDSNKGALTDGAKQVFKIYEDTALAARAKGETGISGPGPFKLVPVLDPQGNIRTIDYQRDEGDFSRMLNKMQSVVDQEKAAQG